MMSWVGHRRDEKAMRAELDDYPPAMTVERQFLDQVAAAVRDPGRLEAVRRTGLLDTAPEESFDALTDAAASLLGTDYAFVTIVDERRSFWKSCRGVELTSDRDRQNTVEESFCQYVIGVSSGFAVADARTDQRTCDNPSVETMGVVAWAGEPIRSGDGHVLGSFCVLDSSPRDWSPRDLEILGTLARAASREVQLWTQVLELQALRSGTEAMGAMTTRLGTHLTTSEAIDVVLVEAPRILDADFVNIALLDGHRQVLRVSHDPGLARTVVDPHLELPLGIPTPLTDAVRTGEGVFLLDPEEADRRYPSLADSRNAVGVAVSASLPLRTSDGTVIGAVGAAWTHPVEMTRTRRAALELVAALCAQTIERTGLTDATKDLVTALTVELFPPISLIAGLEFAGRYRPSNDRLAFGGDWYDVVEVSDDRVLIIVGDVVGHGVEAAARMARVRTVLDTLVQQRRGIEDLLGEAEGLLRRLEEPFLATLSLIEIDLTTDTMRHVSAGHPPALVVRPDGVVARWEGGKRPPLGFGGACPAPTTQLFAPGTTLVVFTDALVASRSVALDHGIDAAARLLADAPFRSASRLCDELVESSLTSDGTNADDVAVVVIRRL